METGPVGTRKGTMAAGARRLKNALADARATLDSLRWPDLVAAGAYARGWVVSG